MPVEFTPEADVPPAERIRRQQWRELDNALAYISHAQYQYEHGDPDAGRMWLDDARRSLGALALLLAEGPDAEGYARLLDGILTPPSSMPEHTYIQRHGRES